MTRPIFLSQIYNMAFAFGFLILISFATSNIVGALSLTPLGATLPRNNFGSRASRQIPNKNHIKPSTGFSMASTATTALSNTSSSSSNVPNEAGSTVLHKALSKFTLLTPLWTTLVALVAISNTTPSYITEIVGSLPIMQNALATLMFAMGLTITPKDVRSALGNVSVIVINALLCFTMMPLLALGLAVVLRYSMSQTAGIILMGSVSGGQASNLFALIAGGDVALSVICTLSTTFLGVLATPLLIQYLLGCKDVVVDGKGVLFSVVSLVLTPLVSGLCLGRLIPKALLSTFSTILPTIGVLATLVLVAGGASNSSILLSSSSISSTIVDVLLPSCLLSVFGGGFAWLVAKYVKMEERSKRTLVVETVSKSPTLAYVIARKHFGSTASAIPAVSMVTLAILGALLASIWSRRTNYNK